MCQASVQLTNVVENEVLQQMQAKQSFTALDISNALKTAKYPVRHRDVAEVVRDIYNSGAMAYYDYDRNLIDVITDGGTQTAQAYLYHHQTVRASDYTRQTQDALPPVSADQARDLSDCVAADPLSLLHRATSAAFSSNASRGRSGRRNNGSRRDGALAISRRIIAQLGWSDGESLSLRAEQGKLIVETSALSANRGNTQTNNSTTPRVKVWSGGRVRICKTKLHLGALSADGVSVSIDGNSLCVIARP